MPAKKRDAAQMAQARAIGRQRRESLATAFRASLRARVARPDDVVEAALIDVATSSFVETRELSLRFELGRCSEDQQRRLGLARGSLLRTLRALGLIRDESQDVPTEAQDADASAPLKKWIDDWRAKQKPAGEPATVTVAHSGEHP